MCEFFFVFNFFGFSSQPHPLPPFPNHIPQALILKFPICLQHPAGFAHMGIGFMTSVRLYLASGSPSSQPCSRSLPLSRTPPNVPQVENANASQVGPRKQSITSRKAHLNRRLVGRVPARRCPDATVARTSPRCTSPPCDPTASPTFASPGATQPVGRRRGRFDYC